MGKLSLRVYSRVVGDGCQHPHRLGVYKSHQIDQDGADALENCTHLTIQLAEDEEKML